MSMSLVIVLGCKSGVYYGGRLAARFCEEVCGWGRVGQVGKVFRVGRDLTVAGVGLLVYGLSRRSRNLR